MSLEDDMADAILRACLACPEDYPPGLAKLAQYYDYVEAKSPTSGRYWHMYSRIQWKRAIVENLPALAEDSD